MYKKVIINGKEYEMEKIENDIEAHPGEYIDIEVHKKKVEEIVIFENPDFAKTNLTRDIKLFSTHLNIIKEVSYIPLSQIVDSPVGWRFFPEYNLEEKCNLKKSIFDNGLLSPIILWENENDTYTLLCGRERVLAFQELLEETNEKNYYEKIPSFVISHNEINDLVARDIMIDENICRRTLTSKTRALVAVKKYGIMQKLKKRKNEINIGKSLARSLDVTPQTIYGYLKLMNLIPEIMKLLQDDKISLKSAKKLATYTMETQRKIYENLGVEHLLDFKISTINISDEENEREISSSIKIAKECTKPYWSRINLKFPTKFLENIIENLENFKKTNSGIDIRFRKPKTLFAGV